MSTNPNKVQRPVAEIEAWLRDHHAMDVADLTPLRGGYWSSAWAFRAGREERVLRLGESGEGFEVDAGASRFGGLNLPVPEVIEIGEAMGLHYAISRRHHGRFLEEIEVSEASTAAPALAGLLAALRQHHGPRNGSLYWYDPGGPREWRGWIERGLHDNPDSTVGGWRALLAQDARLDRLFRDCVARIRELLPACPERRDLLHRDLLHQNVLVAPDARRITGVFSWKCSMWGDFLYDVACCTFWRDWHPGVAATDPWSFTREAGDLGEEDLRDAALRHHCYELHIGATHLGWTAWTGVAEDLEGVARATERVLARGPLG